MTWYKSAGILTRWTFEKEKLNIQQYIIDILLVSISFLKGSKSKEM